MGHIVWAGDELSAEGFNKLFKPIDHITLKEGWSLKDIKLRSAYPNFNAYVFCYSQVENIFQIWRTSGGKAMCCYFITDLPDFVRITTKAVKDHGIELIKKYEPKYADHLIKHLRLFDVTYKINYTDASKDRIVTEENLESFITKQFYAQDFHQKNKSFSYEREIRTVWIFLSIDLKGRIQPLQIPPPEKDYLDLTLGNLPISKWPVKNVFQIKTAKSKESTF